MSDINVRAVVTAQDNASGVLGNIGGSFGKMTGAVFAGQAAFAAISGATQKFNDILRESVNQQLDHELVVTRLKAGILNVTSATNKNVDSLIAQAAALQKVTRFSDDQVISAQGILTTFQLNQDAISKLTPRLIDMSEGLARASGEMPDLEGNAQLVAKAIGGEDTAGLVGALRRVGVIMTAHQEQILQTGDMQQRLATITGVLDQNFKGLGEAAGSTGAGKMAEFQNAVQDLQKSLGVLIEQALIPLINWVTPIIVSITAFADKHQTLTKAVLAGTIVFFGLLAVLTTVGPIVIAVGAVFGSTALLIVGGVGLAIAAVVGLGVAIASNFNAIKSAIGAVPPFIVSVFRAVANAIADPFRTGLNSVIDMINGVASKVPGLSKFRIPDIPRFATGVQNFSGGLAVVGEQGPELVNLPRGSSVIPNNQLGGGNTINVSVNGVFTGTPSEGRKLAQIIAGHLQDIAGAKNMTVGEFLG